MSKPFLAACAALLALAQPSLAHAQNGCVAAADVSAGVIYTMPIAYDAARTVCRNQFKPDGFVARKGDTFIAPFRARQSGSWPGAFRVLKTYMNRQADPKATGGVDLNAMIASLPDSTLRPFVDGTVGQMIAKEIKPENCGDIERGLELLSPLPTENVAGLMAFIAEVGEFKNPSICPPKKQ
ncbi:hypothetical protein [Erythrobacter sp. JK5]|uniref:hypothetical protein n=1 Tax=Erythrobacter sp. JK5 TaxID=2829500 RepID=UPI001BA5AA82|nr:hypothetical protein [Erythrobacter sp. JK5]QUL38687.1 hypothetical protein KDC96_04685 [Erythrobacter sp. JK5]